jgi:hypothetical protein
MLATYYGSLASLSNPANGLASPAVAVGTAIDTLDGANAHPATSGIFGVRYALYAATRTTSRARCRYSGFVKSTITGLVTWAFAADANSRVQVPLVLLLLLLGAVVMLARCG